MDGATEVRNPTDISALGGLDRLDAFFRAQESDGADGPVVFFTHLLPNTQRSKLLADQLVARKQRTKGIVVVCAPGGLTPEIEAAYRDAAIPQFADLATCFDALACAYAAPPATGTYSPHPIKLPTTGDDMEVLRAAGIPIVETREAADACPFPFPVVLKAMVPGVAHKAKEGLVITDITDVGAYREALAKLRRHGAPVIVQPQIAAKAELILGVITESRLGKFLLLGVGGIHTEILDEIVLWPIPSLPDLTASRIGRLVTALGAEAPVLDALSRLQDVALAAGDTIESVDVNPLIVTGTGVVAVDALIVRP
jgi:acyl-CoA synthetase (NDP forming)